MAARNFSNIAVETTLNSGIGSGDSSLAVATATGWPAAPFALIIDEGLPEEELILVGTKAGTTFGALTRGAGGTSASAHVGGASAKHVVIAEDLAFIASHAHNGADDSSTISHGDLVGLTLDHHTQYLKEKGAGGVAGEIPEHDHSNASQAGALHSQYATDTEVTAAVAAEAALRSAEDVILDGRLDTAEADITALAAADASLDARLDTAETDITNLETADGVFDGRISALESRFLGYAEESGAQTGIGSSVTDLTNLAITVDVPAGARIRLSGHVVFRQRTAAGSCVGSFREGSTTLGRWATQTLDTDGFHLGDGSIILEPTTGSHTYKLSLSTTGGTVDTIATGQPHYIMAEVIEG